MASWEEFSQNISMHGVRTAGSKKFSVVRRILWCLLILAMLTYLSWSFAFFLLDFAGRTTSTTVKVQKAKQLKFPTITLCNRNLWSRTAIENGVFPVMPEFLTDLYGSDPYGASLRYNYSDPYYAFLTIPNSTETEKYLRSVAIPLWATFLQCEVYGATVNCEDVWSVVQTDGGFCFQFNSNGRLNATAAGRTGGVSFTLNANVNEYFIGPTSFAEGFSVTFNEDYQVPMVKELSVGVAPGTHTSIVLSKSEVKRWPPPADYGRADCFDADNLPNPLHFYNNYSYSACQVECKTSYVLKKCGCRDPFQPALNGSLICRLPWSLNCSAPAMKLFPSDPEGLAACLCKDPCNDVEYSTQMSHYKFPSANYIKQNNMSDATVNFMKANGIVLDIYYGKMSFRLLEEKLAYGFCDMISNLGGTLGLCVGASILTVCEFIEFAVIALSSLFKRDQKTYPSRAPKEQLDEHQ